MIWICTLCLLFVAAWLFFNALNEKRWVEAHSHDESVASDEGLFGGFSLRTGTGATGVDGKVSIDQENTRFARAVSKVKNQTTVWGDKLIESKVSAARIKDGEQRPSSIREENTLFGRAVARVSGAADRREQKFGDSMSSSSHQGDATGSSSGSSEGLVARTSRKVAAKSDEVSQMVSKGAKNLSQNLSSRRAKTEESSVDSTMDDTKRGAESNEADPAARASAKISDSISQMSSEKVRQTDNKK